MRPILTIVQARPLWCALILACASSYSLQAKDVQPPTGIAPEKVADYVHAVLDADRTIYTNHVVNRMQAKSDRVGRRTLGTRKCLAAPRAVPPTFGKTRR